MSLPWSSPAATRCWRRRSAAAGPNTSLGHPRAEPGSASALYTCDPQTRGVSFCCRPSLPHCLRKVDPLHPLLPFVKILEGSSDRIPGLADPHCLQHPRVPQLVQHHGLVKLVRHLKCRHVGEPQGGRDRPCQEALPPQVCIYSGKYPQECRKNTEGKEAPWTPQLPQLRPPCHYAPSSRLFIASHS